MKRLFVLAIALMLGACVQPVAPEKLANIKTIGVISEIGDEIDAQTIGYTVFGNDLKKIPTKDWGIDQMVTDEISRELGGRYQIVPVTYDHAAFHAGKDRDSITNALRNSTPHGLDAYVVVLKGLSGYGRTNQRVIGLGLVRSPGPLFSYIVFAHALYSLHVVDGHQFDQIGYVLPQQLDNDPFPIIRGPFEEVDAPYWAKEDDLPSDQQLVMLKAKLQDLTAKSLPSAVRQLGLTR